MRNSLYIFVVCTVQFWVGWLLATEYHNRQPPLEIIQMEPMTISVTDIELGPREAVECEFEEPLKYLNLIIHWYDTNAEMYADYIALADPAEHDEIWGWSNCVWQPEDNWAACDVYVVQPDFVSADMNMDTLGHEVLHGSCGDFHD